MSHDFQASGPALKRLDSLVLSGRALGILVKAFVERGNRIQFTARGDSMFPFVRDGDRVRVVPYGDAAPGPGDLVAFIDERTQRLMVHRLMSVSPNGFVAKGDNCFHKDALQPRDNMMGYVSRINHRNDMLCGINYLKIGKYVTFFSLLGLTAIIGRILKKIGRLKPRR